MFSAQKDFLAEQYLQMIKLLLLWRGVQHSWADPRGSEARDATGSHDTHIVLHAREQTSVYG